MKQPIPFGKYFLLERINVGGMAEVFKAKATGVEGFERLVAVKRILPSIAEDEEFITMFVDEAKIAVQLTHANIAQIFDLGRVDGSFFIALEYVHGKDLRTMFNRTRQRGEVLPIPLACYSIMKLCEGLDYAHNKNDSSGRSLNLVHRDVSPQNILVSYEGEVKIIDFGIAKAAGKAGRTQAGILKGKFGYMSPEQVQGLEIDRRSDVFGVGICLYELLTGERLFVAESDFATLEKVRSVDIMPPSTYNRRVPEELEQIVMRALARDRDQRHQSALQLHDDLQAFMHTSGNLFSRKDLSGYMHRAFAEEIEQESLRDREFEQLARSPSRIRGGMFEDDIDTLDVQPINALSALSGHNGGHGSAGHHNHGDDLRAQAQQPQPESRRRTATLLGVPRAAGPRVPTVPRPIPGPASIPPLAASRPPRQPGAMPMLSGTTSQGMDWDEEELSTQIYDKPDDNDDDDRDDLGDSRETRVGAGVIHFDQGDRDEQDDELDNMQVSVPPEGDPEAGPLAAALHAVSVGQHQQPAPQQHTLRTAPAPMLPPVRDNARHETRAVPRPRAKPARARPALAAMAAVAGIVACIVLGLLVFGQRQPGTVNLTTKPNRVAVSVDGRALGESTSPFVIGELTPGRQHEIVVSSPGFKPWTREVELTPGQVVTLSNVALERIDTGFALATEPRGANVYVDDKPLPERTPVRVLDLAPGEHRVRVELPGWASWETAVRATAGTVLPLPDVALQPLAMARAEAATPEPEPEPDLAHSGGSRSGRKPGSHTGSWRSRNQNPADTSDDERTTMATGEPAQADVAAEAPQEPTDDLLDDKPSAAPAPPEAADIKPAQPTAANAELGTLRVNSRPWSQVFVDGKGYGHTPRFNIELPAGSHTLELVNDEFGVRRKLDFTITAGKIETLVVNLLQ